MWSQFPTFSRWARGIRHSTAPVLSLAGVAARRLKSVVARRLRFSVRTLLILVVLVATALGLRDMSRRAEAYKKEAESYAAGEASHRRNIDRYAESDPEWDWVIKQKVAYCETMRRKYEHAASRPWLVVSPDPPYPWQAIADRRLIRGLDRYIQVRRSRGESVEFAVREKRRVEEEIRKGLRDSRKDQRP